MDPLGVYGVISNIGNKDNKAKFVDFLVLKTDFKKTKIFAK